MVEIRDVSNYSSDQFALQSRLLQQPMQCHCSYLRGCRASSLSFPAPEDLRISDNKFQQLKALDSTPTPLTRPPRPQWMSDTSTRLLDERTSLHINPQHNRNVVRTLQKYVQSFLLVESRRRAEKAVEEIGAFL